MPSFTKLVAFTSYIALALGAAHPHLNAINTHCPDAQQIKTESHAVNGGVLTISDFSCASAGTSARELDILEKKSTVDVCNVLCTASCNDNAGSLPPVVADCDKIVSGVQILGTNLPTEFTVAKGGTKVLTFDTCSFIFTNKGISSQSQCFKSFVTQASTAGAGCFPPVQPFFSEGVCTATGSNGWTVAAAHSPPSS
ncbi:hypothetical protein M422DRAFT_65200 [Sphaerobolus stellatus SS14]|nr:hypothetical protein M422DRAFT_65200 [Sphaerobolus stellatus SS14]